MGDVAVFITVAALCATAFLWFLWMWAEARAPVLEIVDLRPVASGVASADGARVALLTDAHIRRRTVSARKVAMLAAKSAPDILLLAGDYIDSAEDIPAFKAWLGYVSRVLDAYDYESAGSAPVVLHEIRRSVPIYMCLGNHDMRAFRRDPSARPKFERAMEELGVVILDGMSTDFYANGARYAVTGYKDKRLTFPASPAVPAVPDARTQKEARDARWGMPANPRFALGIAHNPDYALVLTSIHPRYRPDVLLSGHFHGGQIRLPFNFEFACLRRERLCRNGVRRGLYSISPQGTVAPAQTRADAAYASATPATAPAPASAAPSKPARNAKDAPPAANPRDTRPSRPSRRSRHSIPIPISRIPLNLYVSRGIGCVLFPLRFLSRPEVTLIKIP